MRSGLLILPFASLLVAAFGVAMGSAFPETAFLMPIGLAAGAALLALWVVLDFESFKAFFTRKGAKYGVSSGLTVLLGVAVIIGLAVVSSRPRFNKSIDLSRDGLNTLSDDSRRLVENLKKEPKQIKMLAFFSDEQARTQFRDLATLYQGIGADFEIEYVDPNADPTRAMALKVTDANTVVVRQGENEKRLTTFNEEKLTNALINVLKDKTKKVYFTKGHGEGALKGDEATGFKAIVTELENNKYAVEELSLLEQAKVPDDADAVVLAGPKYDLKEEELRMLEDYLKRGGSVMALIPAMTPADNINRTLEKFGVKLNSDLLILAPNDPRAQFLGQNLALVTEFDDFNPVTKDFASQSQVTVGLRFTRSLDQVDDNANKLKVTLAGKTSDVIVRVKDVKEPKDLEGLTEERWEVGSFPVVAVASGKTSGPATASNDKGEKGEIKADSAATGSKQEAKETRLVAVGSVDFATNQGAQEPANRDLLMNAISYLLQDDDFISIRPKDPTKSTLDLTTGGSQLSLLALTFIYPFLFLGTGIIAWLQRRRA